MGLLEVVARLPFVGGLERDVSENTFWFSTPGSPDGDNYAEVITNVTQFYNEPPSGGGSNSIGYYLSSVISRTACELVVRSIDVATGAQLTDNVHSAFTLDAAGTTNNLPLEVSLCLSFKGSRTGAPAGRTRGRVYVGPLQTATATTGGAAYPIPTTTFVNLLAAKADDVKGVGEGGECPWVIYSRSDREVAIVEGGWIDNEWDTQRRRGVAANSRVIWPGT
jgi:hypothetical protein